jgi:hypothetical protein
MAMTKSRKSASKRSPVAKRGPASKRPRRKKGRASLTMDGPGSRIRVDNGSARVSPFATGALAVFTGGVHRQLAVLAKKKIPTAAIIDGQIVRGIPRKVGTRYVLDALPKGSRG